MFRTLPRTLTHQVVLVALGISGCFLLVAALAITSIINMQTAADHIATVTLKQVELSGQFNTDMFRGFAEALSFARTRTTENRESALQEMRDARTLLDDLGELEPIADPYITTLTADHVQLQAHRVAAYNILQPAVEELVRAVAVNDDQATTAALNTLNQNKLIIEQLEEDTSALADRSIEASTRAIAARTRTTFMSTGLAFAFVILLIPASLFLVRRKIVQPINALAIAAHTVAEGQLDQNVLVNAPAELGQLQRAFNQMVGNLATAQGVIADQQRFLEARVQERTADLERAVNELRASLTEREQLSKTIQALASPVIPITDDVLVMPLIGAIDSERAALMTTTLLGAIERQRARKVIIDVTGVPLIDTQVAQTLLQAAQASRLLGTETILVGLRPELAQTIVGLGISLASLVTKANLQSGIRYALRTSPRLTP